MSLLKALGAAAVLLGGCADDVRPTYQPPPKPEVEVGVILYVPRPNPVTPLKPSWQQNLEVSLQGAEYILFDGSRSTEDNGLAAYIKNFASITAQPYVFVDDMSGSYVKPLTPNHQPFGSTPTYSSIAELLGTVPDGSKVTLVTDGLPNPEEGTPDKVIKLAKGKKVEISVIVATNEKIGDLQPLEWLANGTNGSFSTQKL